MKISIICFSLTGYATAARLAEGFQKAGAQVVLAGKSRYLPDSIEESLSEWTGRQFAEADGIVFVGACGIAVRSIAPFVAGKKTDPAVLVADECGTFVISLLSGHLGGANELAGEAAKMIGAVPVVTTATDLHRRFAVDVFAKKNDCAIYHMKAAKEVSAALLAGRQAGFYSSVPWEGELPRGLVACDHTGTPLEGSGDPMRLGVAVTFYREERPFEETVHVVPRCVTLGIGCRKGKEAGAIEQAAEECLSRAGVYREAVCSIASIDLKNGEPGIRSLADRWNIPFVTYTREELEAVPGDFTPSAFVRETTGVDNVCERSAVLSSGQGRLIQNKRGADGVTTALAAAERRIRFE